MGNKADVIDVKNYIFLGISMVLRYNKRACNCMNTGEYYPSQVPAI